MLVGTDICRGCGNFLPLCKCYFPRQQDPWTPFPRKTKETITTSESILNKPKSIWILCPKCNATNKECLVCEGTGIISEVTGNPPKREKDAK